jgi:RNA polymerase sigma-70 factor (ECF subfamily)
MDETAIVTRDDVLSHVRRRIVSFVASRAPRDVAEDVAQDTLMLLTTKYAGVSDIADLVPLALKIGRFKLMNHWRKRQRRREDAVDPEVADLESLARDDSGEEALARGILTQRLMEAIERLGERCRRLLRLRLEGHDFEEIRRRLDAVSINTVYTWDNRCRKQLREDLMPSWEGPVGG